MMQKEPGKDKDMLRKQIYLHVERHGAKLKVLDQHGREVANIRQLTIHSNFDDVRSITMNVIEADVAGNMARGDGKIVRDQDRIAKEQNKIINKGGGQ